MLIPIRCFTCGNPIGQYYKDWQEKVIENKENPKKVLDSFGLHRYCCRRMLITHVELLDETIKFSLTQNKLRALMD